MTSQVRLVLVDRGDHPVALRGAALGRARGRGSTAESSGRGTVLAPLEALSPGVAVELVCSLRALRRALAEPGAREAFSTLPTGVVLVRLGGEVFPLADAAGRALWRLLVRRLSAEPVPAARETTDGRRPDRASRTPQLQSTTRSTRPRAVSKEASGSPGSSDWSPLR